MKFKNTLVCICVALLVACAGPDAYKMGKVQLEQGNWEAAIASLSKAVKSNPNNIEYQYALRQATEAALNDYFSQAAILTDKQQSKAVDIYRKILLISPSNQRALEQIKVIENSQYAKRVFLEATQAAAVGRDQEAIAKFKKLINENPSNLEYRKALKEVEEKSGKAVVIPILHERFIKPVSVSFKDASAKMIFDALSVSHGINFIMDRDLKDDIKTSITLKNVPFDDAMEQILSSLGMLKRVVNSNTILIYQNTPQKLREFQDLIVRNFFIESADVKQLSAMLKAVLKIRDIFTDEKRNLIVIRDTPLQVASAEKLIAAHDQAESEVVLDVEIIELDHKLSESLGVLLPTQVGFGVANPVTLDILKSINNNNSAVNVTGLGSIAQLNMQNQAGITKVLANPSIRIRNREKAKFHVGDKVPVITTTTYPGTLTGATTSNVSYLDVGIKLELEPIIQLDDQVIIKTTMEDSSITNTVVNNGTTAYQIGTRNVSTTLTLRDGETQVLAGLIRSDEQNTTDQVPGLGDIPGLGRIFQNPSKTNEKKEILLSITPHVVQNIHRPTDDLLEINSGPDSQPQNGVPNGVGNVRSQVPPVTNGNQNRSQSSPPQSSSTTTPSILTPLVPFGQTSPSSSPATVGAPASTPTPTANQPTFDLPPGVGTTK